MSTTTRTGTIQKAVTHRSDPVEIRSKVHGYITSSHRQLTTTTYEICVEMTIDVDAAFERLAHRAAESKTGIAKQMDGFLTASVLSRRVINAENQAIATLDQQFPDEFELVTNN